MEPDTLVFALATQDFLYEKMVSNVEEIREELEEELLESYNIYDTFMARVKKEDKKKKEKKPSMSFWTALSLSFNNLMTKRARTVLTSFAGSIGIIGIALVLSLSTGINAYIDQVQEFQ